MLRVGLSLPQNAHPICVVPSCSFLPCLQVSSRIRFITHKGSKSDLQSDGGSTRNSQDEVKYSVPLRKVKDTWWKYRFIRRMGVPKQINPSLPSKSPTESSTHVAAAGGTKSPAEKLPGIMIHPAHRASYNHRAAPLAERVPTELPRRQSSSKSYWQFADDGPQNHAALLKIIAETRRVSEAWEAYSTLISVHRSPRTMETPRQEDDSDDLNIPYGHLHRLARLLSRTYPRTRQLFLRLLSVLTTIRTSGGDILLWEWNALINCAGKGWRKTTVEDYRAAVDIFKDMVTSNQAALSSPGSQGNSAPPTKKLAVAQPDIFTFTTLLSIASHTLNEDAIQHAMSLLSASELPWNGATHLARLPYFIHTNQLQAVRDILSAGVTRGLDIVTLNGCLWAYAYKGRLRIVMQVYDLLRRNVPQTDRADLDQSDPPPIFLSPEGDKGEDENPFLNMPGFIEQATMVPDAITYTLLIQALCYHGDLIGALTVFYDMVSTVDPLSRPPPSYRGKAKPGCFQPSYAIYRAIFLGFARHAHKKPLTLGSSLLARLEGIDAVPLREFAARITASNPTVAATLPSTEDLAVNMPWTLENLDMIFNQFLEMDWKGGAGKNEKSATSSRPSDRMIYWIMVAYAKTTNRDTRRMHDAWKRLDARFGYSSAGMSWRGRLGRIGRKLEERERQTT